MEDLIQRALQAKRESKHIEFKSAFDPSSAQDWCELIKDIVAIVNTGGGVIIFGVDNFGNPCGFDVQPVLQIDMATITDKVAKYTTVQLSEFEILQKEKVGTAVALLLISPIDIPLVFSSPGTYTLPTGKQQTAFSRGAVYFRHGAKSEPANRDDLRVMIEKNLEGFRRSWIKGVRKVVQAPRGHVVQVLPPEVVSSHSPLATPIRLVDDPSAPAYFKLTPDISHPYRQKDVITQVNQALTGEAKINQFDLRAARALHGTDKNETFSYRPRFSSQQYSQAFIDWLILQYRANSNFFLQARSGFAAKSGGK